MNNLVFVIGLVIFLLGNSLRMYRVSKEQSSIYAALTQLSGSLTMLIGALLK